MPKKTFSAEQVSPEKARALNGVLIELNSSALDAMHCKREMVIVSGTRHVFEEPGTLDHIVALARDWFVRHVGREP